MVKNIKKGNKNLVKRDCITTIRNSNLNPPVKLLEHLKALNTAYANEHYVNCIILFRAILDYIPPIFGYRNALELISQLNSKITFRKVLDEFERFTRNLADDALHNPANKIDIIKITKQTVDNLAPNLLLILETVARQLHDDDKRNSIKKAVFEVKEANKTKLQTFELYVEKEKWYEQYIGNKKIWICEKDNLCQIHEQNDYGDFSDSWTQVYPDKFGSGKHSVDLIYDGNHIKRFTFVYCDGARINVVLPRFDINNSNYDVKEDNRIFYWITDSLDYKLMKLIGFFYAYETPEAIAKRSKIELRKE
jgi:hypothetical protein